MSIGPFSPWPAAPEGESRRTRLALIIGAVGISMILLAYALSPGVRHAVVHAEHSVKHAVSHVFDRDHHEHKHASHPLRPAAGRRHSTKPAP